MNGQAGVQQQLAGMAGSHQPPNPQPVSAGHAKKTNTTSPGVTRGSTLKEMIKVKKANAIIKA